MSAIIKRRALASAQGGDVIVDWTDTHQRIDGFGAANAPQGLDSTKADLFFTTNGIGLSLMRLPFASNGPGPSPYFPETTTFYADSKFASDRGALVWAAPWTAMNTAWKSNASLVQGHLLSAHSSDFATYQAGLQADLVTNTGAPTLYGMSLCNEPDLADGAVSYESMQMTATEMVAYLKVIGPTFATLNPKPLLIAPECENWDNAVSYLSTLSADALAYSYIDIYATHQYEGTVVALNTTKRVWQTEMSDIGAFDASIANGLTLAGRVHTALVTGNVNAWHAWWTRGNQANGLGLIGQSADDSSTKRFFCLGNFSKFIRPGHFRVGVSNAPAGVSMSAFRDLPGKSAVIVAINTNGTSTAMRVRTINEYLGYSVAAWETSATNSLALVAGVSSDTGAFAYTLPATSVTTFQGTIL